MKELNFYEGKRILITGHTGFKGGWLSIWLNMLGAEVYGYALDPIQKEGVFSSSRIGSLISDTRADIRDVQRLQGYLNEIKPEMVFHLAAQPLVLESYNNPRETFEVNVQGTVNVLEAIRACNSVKASVFITSDKCYENRDWIFGYRENDRLGGHDPYSASKAASEIVIASYRRSFFDKNSSVGIASVRAGNVIGGGDWSANRLVPDIFRALREGKGIELRNPDAIRPWQHVLEPLAGYLILGARLYEEKENYSGAWNFGPFTHEIHTVSELALEIIKNSENGTLTNSSVPESNFESTRLTLDISKANQLLGWYPILGFKEMVRLTTDWYMNYQTIEALALSQAQIVNYQKKWNLFQENRQGLPK